MLTKQKVYQVETTENDHVQVRCKTKIMEDGVEISSSLHRHVISPGQDYSGEIGKVRRCCAAAHIPVVVDKQVTADLYETAKRERQEAVAARDVAEQARADAMDARTAAKDAYDAAVVSGAQEDIDAALELKAVAVQAHTDAVAARTEAQTASDEAEAAALAAREAREAAKTAHKEFTEAEG